MSFQVYSLVFLTCFLMGCRGIRYVNTFDSSNVIKTEKSFYSSNDDLQLTYSFRNGTLRFTIFNKSDKPIFIDWESSNFIFNGYTYDYYSDKADFVNVSRITFAGNQASDVSIGIIQKEKPVNQIPPKALIPVSRFGIRFRLLSIENPEVKAHLRENGYYQVDFSPENSPVQFRNYIGYSFDKSLTEMKYIDDHFWLSSFDYLYTSQFEAKYKSTMNENKYQYILSETPKGVGIFILLTVFSIGLFAAITSK